MIEIERVLMWFEWMTVFGGGVGGLEPFFEILASTGLLLFFFFFWVSVIVTQTIAGRLFLVRSMCCNTVYHTVQ